MKRAYQILGLNEDASLQDVKRAYRKLALKFHPDKNTEPGAVEKFLLINEAYEIITSKKTARRKISRPEGSENGIKKHPKDPEEFRRMQREAYNDRIRQAKERWEQQTKKEELENLIYFKRLTTGNRLKIFYTSILLSIIMNFFFTYDYFAKGVIQEKTIEDITFSSTPNFGRKDFFYMIEFRGYEFFVSAEMYAYIFKHPKIEIEFTPIFKDIKAIRVRDGEYLMSQPPLHSLMYFFPLIQIVLLIPLIAYFLMNPTPLFGFLYFISIYVIFPLIIILLIVNDRFLHMINYFS